MEATPTSHATLALNSFAWHVVQQNLLSEKSAQIVCQAANKNQISLIQQLHQQNDISQKALAHAIALYFGLPFFDLTCLNVAKARSMLAEHAVLQKHLLLPLYQQNQLLYLAVSDPTASWLADINFMTGLNTALVIVEADQLKKLKQDLSTQTDHSTNQIKHADLIELEVSAEAADTTTDDLSRAESAPIVRYIQQILLEAIKQGASDIHFEPYDRFYRIRFRLDGVLCQAASPPLKLANYFIARLKIMAHLDISERRLPQDGRFQINLAENQKMDFRVSTCPTLNGEKVVLRLLDSSKKLLDLDYLGMNPKQKALFHHAIKQSQGMILVTGPTGSGKTVTLYTGLKILNQTNVNISTVEDPIEIHLPGINQVQVNAKTGLDFATALRAFLRQDPDIMMLGEIRDLETAQIAIKASQTGHLVLSTLHTNSAAETLIRLANMGIPAYNIASSIVLIIAQRLIRKLCPICKEAINLPTHVLIAAGFQTEDLKQNLQLFDAKGCENCHHGYQGRIGIYEMMPMTQTLMHLILKDSNALVLAKQAEKAGMLNLRQASLEKVKQGITSLAEINRITTYEKS